MRPPANTIPSIDPEPEVAVPSTAPSGKMYLKLRRSQRATAIVNRPVFILDARVELSPEDLQLVRKYRLGSQVVYDSKERRAHQEAAYDHFSHQQVLSMLLPGRAIWKGLRGVVSATRMLLSLRVTVNSLISGQHIECKDLNELVGAERAMREACENLRTYLEIAATFDGRENDPIEI
jgi:hypothetical protein